ncbi:MAG: alpha/beta fold hydrolase [Micromonosporaceae bacterium]
MVRTWYGRLRRSPGRLFALLAALLLTAGLIVWYAADGTVDYRTEERMLPGATPDGEPAQLDTTLYVPETAGPAPAVLLAHGFGGTKDSVTETAQELAGQGYVVLTYTARGFGRSTGRIHLNAAEYEVADAQRLLDWLATRDEVLTDGAGDPRVAAMGASYGGALSLLLAGHDDRVDAIVPQATWHDLGGAFLPEATGAGPATGVFKRAWAGLFFGTGSGMPAGLGALTGGGPAGTGPGSGNGSGSGTAPDNGSGTAPGLGAAPGSSSAGRAPGDVPNPACGRFAPQVCQAYLQIATTGRATPEAIELFTASSPAGVLDKIKAPTLLVQGLADSLFPLAEADANARGITHAPVRVAWFSGGHDGPPSAADEDRVKYLSLQWLDHYLKGNGDAPGGGFTYSRATGVDANTRGLATTGYVADAYPGLTGDRTPYATTLTGPPQPIANPPDGTPAALSSLPGLGGLSGVASGLTADLPGQHARYLSAPLAEPVDVAGTPSVSIKAASPTGEAVLFVKLYDLSPSGGATLPNGLVAPVRLTDLPDDIADAKPVTVTLPGIVHRFETGHRLLVVVASSDQAYTTPTEPAVYTVGIGDPAVSLPRVENEPLPSPAAVLRWVLVGLVATLLLGTLVAVLIGRWRHRRSDRSVIAEYADVPLVVRELRKEYADGFVAVSTVDFTVQRGQVVGLLGPNGAGKTTTLRTLLGLIQPTAGDALVFGHRLTPGAPVLSRLGALVEGPGFLPHLSGVDNLKLFWQATGRPIADAQLDEVLRIAGLGSSVHRKVRTYSHGMKQRLAIAQAMLGLPELLVLDEPTDGLDPPQIAEMRRVLRDYADDRRAVLVSSHLLAEVEQTCTHVVVVHRGALVASGPVDDIVGESPTTLFDVTDLDAGERALRALDGINDVGRDGAQLVADLNGTPRAEAVKALVTAGVGVQRVVPRRRLEDAFLTLVSGDGPGSER